MCGRTMDLLKAALFSIIILSLWGCLEAVCYFPQQFQGEFVMQTSFSGSNNYATVNVTPVAIPIWGNCHRRIGNNFILMINYRGTTCVRCLHLKLRSANVLQVFTLNQEIISKCYTTEALAEEDCPSEESLANREAAEILLFKTKDAIGSYTRKEYCPIDGKFAVQYRSTNPRKPIECNGVDSTMDSCPSGSTLNYRLRGCTGYDVLDLVFECLATWKGPQEQNFLIVKDNRQMSGQKAKYRCALYSQDVKTGEIQMALSKDSTCSTDLYNSTSGFETFSLSPKTESPWPVETSLGTCSFPKWMHGNWEHVRVDADQMVYKDHTSFITYTIKCVGVTEDEDKYIIFSRTQCNQERYNCMRVLKRNENILEFQLGSNASSINDVFALCSNSNFQDETWITQGRIDLVEEPLGTCPISGEYVGVIPDGEDLCAKLWSDCAAPQLMYYQVSHCRTREVYEEREYQCLGHWDEGDVLYTYTQRRDVAQGTYECFVGMKVSNREIYIKEAGEHCQRNVNPYQYGMQLNKTSLDNCLTTARPAPTRTTARPRPAATTAPTPNITTRVWNFDSAGAETKNNENSASATILPQTVYLLVVLAHFLKVYV